MFLFLLFSESGCNANHRSSIDERYLTNGGGKSQNSGGNKNNKKVFGRFAKRSCSVSMEKDTRPEPNNHDNVTDSNEHKPEVSL